MDAITAQHIAFSYAANGDPILRDINLNIPKGAITAVLGPNGCGKTTLLYLFIGLLTPRKGDLLLLDRPFGQYRKKEIKQLIGLVPQNESIPFDLNLMEYVLLGRAPFLRLLQQPDAHDQRIALEAIDRVGLAGRMHRSVPTLSSGERQLAAIARILTQTPAILLLDEPTSHLDLGNARKILVALKSIADNDGSVLFTTHDPNAASAVADHIVILGRNGLVAAGKTENTLTEQNLSTAYGQKVEVVQTHRGAVVITF